MTYECGCVNEIDNESGVLRSISKCEFHTKAQTTPLTRDYEHYRSLGCIDEHGIPQNARYVRELKEGLSELDFDYLKWGIGKVFLELGAGLGMYIPLILKGGARHTSIENSPFAVKWIQDTFYTSVLECDLEEIGFLPARYHCIIAAHILEHVKDAPNLLTRCYQCVRERLYLIVPDDQDPVNPDHQWFFTADTLSQLLKRTGFTNIRTQTKHVFEREGFIYCVAEK